MGVSLNLNYSQMGLIGTGNFVGYMISVVMAGMVAQVIGARWTISIGLVLVGGSMGLISQATGFLEVLSLYVATGIGSGLANVPMLGLVSHWFTRINRGRAAGVMLSGNGFGIVFTGLLILVNSIKRLMSYIGKFNSFRCFSMLSVDVSSAIKA
jgi:MFS family permease